MRQAYSPPTVDVVLPCSADIAILWKLVCRAVRAEMPIRVTPLSSQSAFLELTP